MYLDVDIMHSLVNFLHSDISADTVSRYIVMIVIYYKLYVKKNVFQFANVNNKWVCDK